MNEQDLIAQCQPPTVGSLEDFYDIWIGRADKAKGLENSEWLNPFTVYDFGLEGSLELYENYVRNNPRLMGLIPNLRGKLLAHTCHSENDKGGKPCHGDILRKLYLEWADSMLQADPNYFSKPSGA